VRRHSDYFAWLHDHAVYEHEHACSFHGCTTLCMTLWTAVKGVPSKPAQPLSAEELALMTPKDTGKGKTPKVPLCSPGIVQLHIQPLFLSPVWQPAAPHQVGEENLGDASTQTLGANTFEGVCGCQNGDQTQNQGRGGGRNRCSRAHGGLKCRDECFAG
jgi:hypothetical protein